MTELEIIKILSRMNIPMGHNQFERISVKEMCEIMDFLKQKIRNKNGSWTIYNFKKFAFEYKIHGVVLAGHSIYLGYEYSKRKHPIKGFEDASHKYFESFFKIKKKNTTIKLKNKKDLNIFLEDLILLKRKHLDTSNETLIELVSNNIHTGYTKSTLLNYFYEKVDDLKLKKSI
ncbi:MAG: hypothetical protein Q8Q51_11495 [Lutibacter sp.]|nr:hypothetical protein [Lutibacter sp.]